MSDNPQDREPKVSRHGRAYTSLLDGNLLVHVGEKTLFDLTPQDGRDIIAALRDVLNDPDCTHGADCLVHPAARRLHNFDC